MAGQTIWSPSVRRRMRHWVADERAGAVVLLAAAVAALLWANVAPASYTGLWNTEFSLRLGDHEAGETLRTWVNAGLMTLFFFVVGLEARREFDLGELRERLRLVLPLVAGLVGMTVPVVLYLTITAGTPAAHGWGVVMSTDTALALGLLALVGVRSAALRSFLVAVLVVDDLAALAVIAIVYTEHVELPALLVAVAFVVATFVARRVRVRSVPLYVALGLGAWAALLASGLDPVVAGLVLGLLTLAYPAARDDLERATDLVRAFREQPTAELARTARLGLGAAVSPNERLQQSVLPWVTFGVVPLFALANTGIPLGGDVLARAVTSPITLAVVIGYGLGKPLGIVGTSLLLTGASRGRLRPPVGWAGVTGAGTIAGVGFTVALLIASLAFNGPDLEEATLGILASAIVAPALTWLVFRVLAFMPASRRERALLGSAPVLVDLVDPVDPERDHMRGPIEAPVTVVEYGDFECPFCGQAEPTVRELLAERGDVRYVWRHLPLSDVHPRATIAAQAAEAAARQGAFWPMHDLLLENQEHLRPPDLDRHAATLGLDVEVFRRDVHAPDAVERVAEDLDSADRSDVAGTPTFFVNGRRHFGAYDLKSLLHDVDVARTRAELDV
ncbi:Na+/H+ antiporter NhaA [Actinomycetospora endophytica]|uniref:Na(+)/H(+) antiporter NhaA n=1 Tax=Actinomycetospora endophytica TaxID=2291215 RepID=A0ABS8PFH2_9PSEU|nr:Na+/H+ antiporter NhaA [Actinomycetospora endophytica]MCD2196753.1 Na+/H+ antiporter NhaA [Actinomycetospora endophytica]